MRNSQDYLGRDALKDKHCYKIFARNAYVGIWIERNESFMISRYKVGANPYLFQEYHWDIGEPLGTVKPLSIIELCPFQIKEEENYTEMEKKELLNYLDSLEENNLIIKGHNSLEARKSASINFQKRLTTRRNDKTPVHKWLKA